MPFYCVQGKTTVGLYLTQEGLRPPIQKPVERIPILIRLQGIIHYTRSGTRTVVNSVTYKIQNGDFLAVADQLPSGKNQVVVQGPNPTDYAFVMPTEDGYDTEVQNYLKWRPSTHTIMNCDSFENILYTLPTGTQITTPINDVIIVSHAGFEVLMCRLNIADPDKRIYYDELCLYAHDQSRPQIEPRTIRNNPATNIYIGGCNIGNNSGYLKLIKKIFGNQVTVTASKYIDWYGLLEFKKTLRSGRQIVSRTTTTWRARYMLYHFKIKRSARVKNRNQLVRLFQQNPNFKDIDGNRIPQDRWRDWIPPPKKIHARNHTADHCGCGSPFPLNIKVKREYRYRHRTLYDWKLPWPKNLPYPKKVAKHQKIEMLKRHMKKDKKMQPNYPSRKCPYPAYKKYGYKTLDEFVDNLHWNTNNYVKSEGILMCTGSRHEYELRIPITDRNNNVMLNAFLVGGNKKYVRHDIVETDGKLFGKA